MNRFAKDYLTGGGGGGGRSTPVGSQHRRGRSLTGVIKGTDENLDLFSRNRRSLSVASADESDVSMKLGKISVGSAAKLSKSGMDDLLFSADGGKHDYDWLLTPPGTPLFSSSDATEARPSVAAPRSNSTARSTSATKTSRLSVTQTENSYSSRPTRSSSVTRPSVSATNYNTYSSNNRSSSNILNTSSSSVTSMCRPSTPGGRSTMTSTARPSTPTSRSMPSRSSTPVRSRPAPTSSSNERARPPQNHSRPSTPTSRPQIHANSNAPVSRSNSRPSTPTRRNSAPGPVPSIGRTASTGRAVMNGRNSAPTSRGSSPSPRARPPPQPIVPPVFSLDTPPNLRTTLPPDRPVSAGRSRPSAAASARGNSEAPGPVNPPRRPSSPAVTRGRLADLSGKGRLHGNGHSINTTENQKTPPVSESASRRTAKPATATESTGFGRTISKKSLDMALRHMDIRNGSGNMRPMSGTTLFPQSIRHSGTSKGQHTRVPDASVPDCTNGMPSNTTISENGNCNGRHQDGETTEDNGRISAKLSDFDMYESSRYDALLLKEDSKNTNWLHSVDDQSDQGLFFDHRFESLPEPFDPL